MGPFLRDMVNISLREQFIHKYLQYSTAELETCAPIKLCALIQGVSEKSEQL